MVLFAANEREREKKKQHSRKAISISRLKYYARKTPGKKIKKNGRSESIKFKQYCTKKRNKKKSKALIAQPGRFRRRMIVYLPIWVLGSGRSRWLGLFDWHHQSKTTNYTRTSSIICQIRLTKFYIVGRSS